MDTNAYDRLGVTSSASSAEIRRSYRKLALKLHPDKNPDNPDAAAEFAELQKAYALLCDEEARAALDAYLEVQRQKEERGKQRSEKRRKMADDLELRERRGDRFDGQSQEAEVKLKLQRQIDRLKRQAEERQWQAAQARQARAATAGARDVTEDEDKSDEKDDDNDDDEYLKPRVSRLFPAGSAAADGQSNDRKRASRTLQVSDTETRVLQDMMGVR